MTHGIYHRRPATVQAIRWTGRNYQQISRWVSSLPEAAVVALAVLENGRLGMATDAIRTTIEIGDWIICNENGAVFMANNTAFLENYEPAEGDVLDPEGGTNERPLN